MSGVNKVILVGRLGTDPEVKDIGGGKIVCKFSLATSETWTKDGNKQEKTEWHRIIVWGKLGETCGKYLVKGKQAFIEGKIATRSYEDKDGKKVYTSEVIANAVQFLGKETNMDKPKDDYKDHSAPSSAPSFDEQDEIPF